MDVIEERPAALYVHNASALTGDSVAAGRGHIVGHEYQRLQPQHRSHAGDGSPVIAVSGGNQGEGP